MIIAITGASGFIGRALAKQHILLGDEVKYLTRTNSIPVNGAQAFIGDVNSSLDRLVLFLSGVDVFYHCAAEINDDAEMHRTNVDGTTNLLRAASLAKVGKWVQLSSTGVYGNQTNDIVTENTIPYPVNTYEQTKLESDKLVIHASKVDGLNAVIVRPSNVYGRSMKNQSLFGLIKAIKKRIFFFIGSKGAIVNYIHVDNVVNAMLLLANKRNLSNGSIYIVSDFCTIESLVESISAAIHISPPKLRLPEFLVRFLVLLAERLKATPLTTSRVNALTQRVIFSSDKIISEVGYTHLISIQQGVADLAQYATKEI